MKDEIPFNAWSRERIERGLKICTSRHKRYQNDKRVTCITPKMPWYIIRTFLFEAEGAKSQAELQNVIEDIYKRRVENGELFYVHFGNFKKVNQKQ